MKWETFPFRLELVENKATADSVLNPMFFVSYAFVKFVFDVLSLFLEIIIFAHVWEE